MLEVFLKTCFPFAKMRIKLKYKNLRFASGVICDFILVDLWLHSSKRDIIVGNCLIVSKLIQLLIVETNHSPLYLILAAQAEYTLVKLIHTYVRFCSWHRRSQFSILQYCRDVEIRHVRVSYAEQWAYNRTVYIHEVSSVHV